VKRLLRDVLIAICRTADLVNSPSFFDLFGGFRLAFHTENDVGYDNLHDLRLSAIPYTINSWEPNQL
jgi:hypothetical protein